MSRLLKDLNDLPSGPTTFPQGNSEAEDNEDTALETAEFELRRHVVQRDQHLMRLDRLLAWLVREFSRSHLQGLIARGEVSLEGQAASLASRKVKAGQVVEVQLVPPAESLAYRAEPVEFEVVYEDAHVAVINKPAGLVVHPAAGNWTGTLLNGLLHRYPTCAMLPRAGIVHRLDKDTSGLMVVGKTLEAVTALVRDLARHEVRRRYLAIVHGRVPGEAFTIEASVGRDPVQRVRMAVVGSGKSARTDVVPLAWLAPDQGAGEALSVVECALHTGRTHQIRVHMSYRGFALVGDKLYGGRPLLGLTRQALHARELGFEHPVTGQPVHCQAAPPQDMIDALEPFGLTFPG